MAAATASGDDGGVTAAETAPSTAAGGAGGQVGTTTHDSSGGDADERPFGELSLALHLAVWDDNIDEVRRLVELHSGPLRDADGGGGDGGGAAASSGAAEGAGGKSQAGGGGSSPGGHNKACTCLEVRDPRGRTPLQLAYSLNRDVAAKWLVLGGADARARSESRAHAATLAPALRRSRRLCRCSAWWVGELPGSGADRQPVHATHGKRRPACRRGRGVRGPAAGADGPAGGDARLRDDHRVVDLHVVSWQRCRGTCRSLHL